jgi:hypothetical protein
MKKFTTGLEAYESIIEAGIGAAVLLGAGPYKGHKALVYEIYEIIPGEPGVSILIDDGSPGGHDEGGYSKKEIIDWLTFIGRIFIDWEFTNNGNFTTARLCGVFAEPLAKLRSLPTEIPSGNYLGETDRTIHRQKELESLGLIFRGESYTYSGGSVTMDFIRAQEDPGWTYFINGLMERLKPKAGGGSSIVSRHW